jgi:hypothetical protein
VLELYAVSVTKNRVLSAAYRDVETFNTELIQAVYSTKILESTEWERCKVEPTILAEYLFKRLQSRGASQYEAVSLINQTVDYIIEKASLPISNKLEYARKLCDLAVNASLNQTAHHILHPNITQDGIFAKATLDHNVLAASIHCGISALAETIIKDGVENINAGTYFGSAIRSAYENNNIKLIAQLYLAGAKPGVIEVNLAARKGNTLALQLAFDRERGHPYWEPEFYVAAVHGAASKNRLDVLRFLHRRASSPAKLLVNNLVIVKRFTYSTYETSAANIILIEASLHGHSELVQLALGLGANTVAEVSGWSNALISASTNGHGHVVQTLLSNMPEDSGEQISFALIAAIGRGWIRVVQMLLPLEAFHDTMRWFHAQFFKAVKAGQVDVVDLLLIARKVHLQDDPRLCEEAYSWAVSHGYTSIARLLIEHEVVSPAIQA